MKPVKNYYQMSENDIDAAICAMKLWLLAFPTSQKRKRVLFALDVALSAKNVKKDKKNDPFLELVMDTLC